LKGIVDTAKRTKTGIENGGMERGGEPSKHPSGVVPLRVAEKRGGKKS